MTAGTLMELLRSFGMYNKHQYLPLQEEVTIIMRKIKAVMLTSINLIFGSYLGLAQTSSQMTNPNTSTVDVPMMLRGSTPAVEVMVNGQGPFLFAIDTGASGMARVDSSLAAKLKLQTVGKMRAGDPSGRTTTLDVVMLDSIALGGIQFNNLKAPTRDYNRSPRLPKIDGVLGFDLFREYLLTLDFPAKRVQLQRGELPQADGAEVLGYESPNGIPVVELGVGSLKVKAHIDTGNSIGGFILPESLVNKLTLASQPVVVGMGRTVTSQVEIKAARLKDSIRFGRFEFPEPRIVFPALSNNINIGSDALR
ncbi:MAG: retroviral-like aspartic protease family protein, partial [Acidobacteriales bacterium]|nr:retroviral-like aspartic protease family protein [Terriglobales bacterium]